MELFVSGDQLLRGAALNAVLIAEHIENKSAVAQFTKENGKTSVWERVGLASEAQREKALWLAAGAAIGAVAVAGVNYLNAARK
ncbi:hypothetical protein P43SY_010399 [Pythium insidiosum]|uniref:Uncharacterized protein n=1 Tax=Pythium insidiosum TaxID=114742 RepID=A0AAD5L6U9_PYTIN|nr:hypothetical protein P43SY_010399 [Pythium insidiosum]